jgi:hypothetical protein
MINNINYSAIVNQARANGATSVEFDRNSELSLFTDNIKAGQDTLTLSNSALALASGKTVEEVAPTYIRPQTAASLLHENNKATDNSKDDKNKESGLKFAEIMQTLLDQRLGIDRKKLDEIDALIKEIGENENLSPEEKDKIIEQLQALREEVIEEGIERQKIAKQMTEIRENDKT